MMFFVHLLVLQWRSYITNEEGDHLIILKKKLVFLGRKPFFLKVEDDFKCGLGPYLIEPY